MTYADFYRWALTHPGERVRVVYRGKREPGTIGSPRDGYVRVRLAKTSARHGHLWTTVHETTCDSVEVLVGARYRPLAEVLR